MAANLQIVIAGKDDISRELKDIDRGLDGLGKSAKVAGVALATGLAAGFAGLTAAIGASVKQSADFEQALANTRAATGATAEQMARMREEALGIGKDTSKSASEAAEAMGELVKAGMPVEQVISGAARSVVQLAEATGSDVAEMAILTSNALNTFKASGLDAATAAETIAKAANASAVSTSDIATALQAVGPVAAQAGLDMDDFATAIGIMGNNALKGSDAGTSLKTMLTSLLAPSKDGRAALDELGVSVFDADGKTRNFRDILGQLQTSLAGATDQQQAMALKTIFGSDAIRAANILLGEGVQGWDAFKGAMAGAPSLADQAGVRLNTLSGIIEQIKGSLETLAIGLGDKFLPAITEFAKLALKAINGDFKGAWDGAVDLVRDAAPKMMAQLRELGGQLGDWFRSTALPLITRQIEEWRVAFVNWVGPSWVGMVRNLGALLESFARWIVDTALPAIRAKLTEWGTAFWKWVDSVWPVLREHLDQLMTELGAWINQQAPVIAEHLAVWTQEFAIWAVNVWGPNHERLNAITTGFGTWLGDQGYAKMKELLAAAFAKLGGDLKADAERTGKSLAQSFWDGLTAGFASPEQAAKTMKAWADAIQSVALGPLLGPGSVLYTTILRFFENMGIDALKALFKRFTGQDLPIGNLPIPAAPTPPIGQPGAPSGGTSGGGTGTIIGPDGKRYPVPSYAEGAFVPRPTLAIVGDRPGGEYVLGREQLGGVTIHFNAPVYGMANFEDAVMAMLVRAERSGRIAAGVTA